MAITAPSMRSSLGDLKRERDRRREAEEARRAEASRSRPNIGDEPAGAEESPAPFTADMDREPLKQTERNAEVIRDGANRAGNVLRSLANSARQIGAAAVAPDKEPEPRAPGVFDVDPAQAQAARDYDSLRRIGIAAAEKYGDSASQAAESVGNSAGSLGEAMSLPGRAASEAGRVVKDTLSPGPVAQRNQKIRRDKERGAALDKSRDLQADYNRALESQEYRDAFRARLAQIEAGSADRDGNKSARNTWDLKEGTPEYEEAYREFVSELTGIEPTGEQNNTFGERVQYRRTGEAPISAETAEENMDGADWPTLAGGINQGPSQGDTTNAARIRNLRRSYTDQNKPVPIGVQVMEQSSQVDPVTGLPLAEGMGAVAVPTGTRDKDGRPGFRRQRRAPTPEINEAMDGMRPADRPIYFAQAMGLDLSQLPEEERYAAALNFYQEHYEKPLQNGYEVSRAPGTAAIDENGQVITDADGNALGTPVFVPGEKLKARREQRRQYNAARQEATGMNGASRLARRYGNEDGTFNLEQFEAENPGVFPQEGDPGRNRAIDNFLADYERGQAVRQGSLRRGQAQLMAGSQGPVLLRESLEQAQTPEERMIIAAAYGQPGLAQAFQEQAMADRAILRAEKEAEAVGRARAAGASDINLAEQPGGALRLLGDQVSSGVITGIDAANELETGSGMEKEQAVNAGARMELMNPATRGLPAGAKLNLPAVNMVVRRELKNHMPNDWIPGQRGAEDGLLLPGYNSLRDSFITASLSALSQSADDAEMTEALGRQFDIEWVNRGNQLPSAEGGPVEVDPVTAALSGVTQVGLPDGPATMPPVGVRE